MNDYQRPPEFDYIIRHKQENCWLVTQPKLEQHKSHRLHPDPPVEFNQEDIHDTYIIYGWLFRSDLGYQTKIL